MRTSRRFAVAALFLGFAWVTAGGCASSDPSSHGGATGGTSGGTTGGIQGDPMTNKPGASGMDSGLVNDLNPLCGEPEVGACTPDDENGCTDYVPPVIGSGGSSTGGAAGESAGGVGNEAGISGAAAAQAGAGGNASGAAAGGATGATGASGAGGEGGNGRENPPGAAAYSCQVVRQNSRLARQCVPAGAGKVNAPCFSAGDCAAGFACVTAGDAGRCLPYCCDQHSTCTSGTYCAEQPLRNGDASSTDQPRVPVCVPADACSLEEQFPCPAGSDCRCKGDTACMIVRDDGTTTCLKPGTGQQGDACPCAWNHVCSSVTQQCVKICHTDPTKNDCGTQKCQAFSSERPQNFGVCVGPH